MLRGTDGQQPPITAPPFTGVAVVTGTCGECWPPASELFMEMPLLSTSSLSFFLHLCHFRKRQVLPQRRPSSPAIRNPNLLLNVCLALEEGPREDQPAPPLFRASTSASWEVMLNQTTREKALPSRVTAASPKKAGTSSHSHSGWMGRVWASTHRRRPCLSSGHFFAPRPGPGSPAR